MRFLLATAVLATCGAFACSDNSPEALTPGIWLALAQQSADLSSGPVDAPLRVLDLVSGEEKEFGPPSLYVLVAWSPRGDRLAALGLDDIGHEDGSSIHLRIWEAGGELLEDRDSTNDFERIEGVWWSPDGTRLAIVSRLRVVMLNEFGQEVGSTPSTPSLGGASGGSGNRLGPSPWAPDSRQFAALLNGLLIVTDKDGNGVQHDLPVLNDLGGFTFNGWSSASQISLVAMSGTDARDTRIYAGVPGLAGIDWDGGQPFDYRTLFPDEQRLASLNALVPGLRFAGEQRTADGGGTAGWLFGAEGPARGPVESAIRVEFGGRTTVATLGPLGQRFLRVPFDVTIVPGWKGETPERVQAARAVPAATPRATPTNRPPGTAFPSVGPPYPKPKGERVQPQVAGLPVFPGSREIDGFKKDFSGAGAHVQMFATADSSTSIVPWFRRELEAIGFRIQGAGDGVVGEDATFIRGRDRVQVSTAYIARPEDELPRDQPPYGYIGKGHRYTDRIDGEAFFFVVTLRAP